MVSIEMATGHGENRTPWHLFSFYAFLRGRIYNGEGRRDFNSEEAGGDKGEIKCSFCEQVSWKEPCVFGLWRAGPQAGWKDPQ